MKKVCVHIDCGRFADSRQVCRVHYDQLRARHAHRVVGYVPRGQRAATRPAPAPLPDLPPVDRWAGIQIPTGWDRAWFDRAERAS